MSVRDNIRSGKYTNNLPFEPFRTAGMTDLQRARRAAYKANDEALLAKFKYDLLAEHGLLEHPKADRAYALAWDEGHSSGLEEIVNYFEGYADLLK